MKYAALLVLAIFCSSIINAQEKHALVVGISNYPSFPEPVLASSRDVKMVERMLLTQGFLESNIQKLCEEEATSDALHNNFSTLINRVEASDIVYFHFSGHGRRVIDQFEKDESDGYDESLVMYNASNTGSSIIRRNESGQKEFPVTDVLSTNGYFLDDQLNYYLNRLREKLGGSGEIIVVLDCCHSGTGTRDVGDSKTIHRGIAEPFAPEGYSSNSGFDTTWYAVDLNYKKIEGLASLTSYFGCKASETNKEYKLNEQTNIGALTYFFCKAIAELDSNSTHRNLYSKIRQMNLRRELSSPQHMLYNSDNSDALIFNGTLIEQEASYSLSELYESQAVIEGGLIHGFMEGDTIGFFENTTTSVKGKEPEFKGVIHSLEVSKAKVNLLTYRDNHKMNDHVLFRAFQIGWNKAPLSVRVKLDFDSKKFRKLNKELRLFFSQELHVFLASNQNIEIDNENPDIVITDSITDSGLGIILKLAKNNISLRSMEPISVSNSDLKEEILKLLLNEVKLKNFLFLDLDDDKLDLKIEFNSERIIESGDTLPLKISNNSNRTIYWSFLNIDVNHEMSFVTKWLSIDANESFETILTPSCEGASCGESDLVFIFSFNKIDGIDNLTKMGSSLAGKRSVSKHPFYEYFDNSIEGGTRGGTMKPKSITLRHHSIEMVP